MDAQGRWVPWVEKSAKATVEGNASLAAFGTGISKTPENYTRGAFTSYQGRLMAVVRAGYIPGDALLRISMDGFPEVEAQITVTE